MAIPASFSLADAKPTPVTHVFTTIFNPEGGLVAATDAPADLRYTLNLYVGNHRSGAEQRNLVTKVPVIQVVDGVSRRMGYDMVSTLLTTSDYSTVQHRKDALKIHENALANAVLRGAMENMTKIY